MFSLSIKNLLKKFADPFGEGEKGGRSPTFAAQLFNLDVRTDLPHGGEGLKNLTQPPS